MLRGLGQRLGALQTNRSISKRRRDRDGCDQFGTRFATSVTGLGKEQVTTDLFGRRRPTRKQDESGKDALIATAMYDGSDHERSLVTHQAVPMEIWCSCMLRDCRQLAKYIQKKAEEEAEGKETKGEETTEWTGRIKLHIANHKMSRRPDGYRLLLEGLTSAVLEVNSQILMEFVDLHLSDCSSAFLIDFLCNHFPRHTKTLKRATLSCSDEDFKCVWRERGYGDRNSWLTLWSVVGIGKNATRLSTFLHKKWSRNVSANVLCIRSDNMSKKIYNVCNNRPK